MHLGGNRPRVPLTHGMLRFNKHGNSCRPQYLGKDSDPDCSSKSDARLSTNKLKLLFRFLTIADLLVGLISQPFYVIFLVSLLPKINMDHVAVITGNVFFSVTPSIHPLMSASIIVERLVAVLL